MSRKRRVARGPERPIVTARTPADLVAAVPYVLGFTPARSVVVVSLRGSRLRFGLVARLDLPDEGTETAAARSLCSYVRRDDPREVVIVVYDDQPWARVAAPPGTALVEAIEAELAEHGVGVREALYVTGQRYWSYGCTSNECCPDAGRALSEATASPVAAAYVFGGRSPFADRESLAARVAPAGPITTAAVESVLVSSLAAVAPWWQRADSPVWTSWQAESIALFDAAANRYLQGGRTVSPQEAGRLLAGLTDVLTRDVLAMSRTRWWPALPGPPADVGTTFSDRPDLMPGPSAVADLDDEQVCDSIERLLVDLAVRVEGLGAVAPLTLLAMHAWSCGNGAQARVAVERALAIDPQYSLAELVQTLLQSGVAPRWADVDRSDDDDVGPGRRATVAPLRGNRRGLR